MAAHDTACIRGLWLDGNRVDIEEIQMDGPSASARVRLLFSLFLSSCGFKHTALFFVVFMTFLPLAGFLLSHKSGSASLHYGVGSGSV